MPIRIYIFILLIKLKLWKLQGIIHVIKFILLNMDIQKNEFLALSFYSIFSSIFLAKAAFSDSGANSITFFKFFFASSKSPLLRYTKAS